MNTVIYTVIVSLVIAVVLGLLLGLFKKIFAVKVDPRVELVRAALSGANCGGCGYAGCDSFAKAVVQDGAPLDGCVAGGPSCAKALAQIMGGDAKESVPKVAIVRCQGDCEVAIPKGVYTGIPTCKGADLVCAGTKKCSFGCIGLGDCVAVCPFGALSMGQKGLPVVDTDKCVGCGKCVSTCPKHVIALIDKNTKGAIALCNSHSDQKAQIKKDCSRGCFKCGLCARKCPEKAIDVSSGLPVVDYQKCTSCGTCATSCVDKVFTILGKA